MQDIYTLQCLKFYYKFDRKQLPMYFKDFFKRNSEIHDHNTRNRNSLHLTHYNNSSTKNCIRFYIPNLINSLPANVKDKIESHSLSGFAHYAKIYLIGRYQNNCVIQNCYICNRS